MYKSYIETKHENRNHLGLSEMGKAGYLLTRPRINVTITADNKNKLVVVWGVQQEKVRGITTYNRHNNSSSIAYTANNRQQ